MLAASFVVRLLIIICKQFGPRSNGLEPDQDRHSVGPDSVGPDWVPNHMTP